MNVLKHINLFINQAPLGLEKRQHAEYFGIFLSCVCGVFANIILLSLFAIESMLLLSISCVSGIIFWSFAAYLARRGKFAAAVYVGVIEMSVHVAIIVVFIGTDYGIQMILWSTIAFSTLHISQKPSMTIRLGLLIAVELALLYELLSAKTNMRPYEGYENMFFMAMTILSALPLMLVLFRMKGLQIAQRKKLQKQIYNDELTGLHNRHFLYESLEYEKNLMKSSSTDSCICLADIDYFKKINDTYGHQTGDEVLVSFANLLRQNLRKSQVICRWGGEEFVIVLPKCDIDAALLIIEKIRSVLVNTGLSSKQLKVTVSCSIVSLHASESLATVFKKADELLYKAKCKGRDRIEVEAES